MNIFTKFKVSFQDLIDLCGGVKSFIVMSVAILIITPFILLYFFVLRPTYRGIRVLLDAKELGWKTAYRKHFYPDEYEHEEWKKADEERERMNVPLIPAGKYREFKDKKVWPDAYVVDGVAIYANEGRTLLYVHDRVEEFMCATRPVLKIRCKHIQEELSVPSILSARTLYSVCAYPL